MEIYILPSGEEVDLTGYPENQIVMWLSNNPGATKKAGGNCSGCKCNASEQHVRTSRRYGISFGNYFFGLTNR
jgi:hypothetical protein